MSKAKTSSSRRWLSRQHSDIYILRAKNEGYRSRSAYKLLELQEKDKLLRPGMAVIDLGAAPGGWSQVVAEIIGQTGYLIALDILTMEPLSNVDILEGDFREPAILKLLMDRLENKLGKDKDNKLIDLVISDMAPNLSGMSVIDQPRSILLAELALELSTSVLKKRGSFIG